MDKIMFGVRLNEARAEVTSRKGVLTSGMSGVSVQLEYGNEWKPLVKTAVFRAGDVTKDILNIDRIVAIPPEVLVQYGLTLQMGVFGLDESGKMVFPTVWATLGMIAPGADPSGDESATPTLPVWSQLLLLFNKILKFGAILPRGGQKGQALVKNSGEDFDAGWQYVSAEGGAGTQGPQGPAGADGKSAYEIAVSNGFVGTETEWLGSLKGETGIHGPQGEKGDDADVTPVIAQLDALRAGTEHMAGTQDEHNCSVQQSLSQIQFTVDAMVNTVRAVQQEVAGKADAAQVGETAVHLWFGPDCTTVAHSPAGMEVRVSEGQVEFSRGGNSGATITDNGIDARNLNVGCQFGIHGFSFVRGATGNLSLRWTGE